MNKNYFNSSVEPRAVKGECSSCRVSSTIFTEPYPHGLENVTCCPVCGTGKHKGFKVEDLSDEL